MFLPEELDFIQNRTGIRLRFGCAGNVGKFDINTDGMVFKCFPLHRRYEGNPYDLDYLLKNGVTVAKNIAHLSEKFGEDATTDGECTGNRDIKKQKDS